MAILDVRLKQIVEDNISDVQSINDLNSQLKKYFETYPLASYNFSLYRRWAAFKADRQHDVKGAIVMLDNCQNSTTLKPQDIAFAKLATSYECGKSGKSIGYACHYSISLIALLS